MTQVSLRLLQRARQLRTALVAFLHLLDLHLDVYIRFCEFLYEPLCEMEQFRYEHHFLVVEVVNLLTDLVQLSPEIFIVDPFLCYDLLFQYSPLCSQLALLLRYLIHE